MPRVTCDFYCFGYDSEWVPCHLFPRNRKQIFLCMQERNQNFGHRHYVIFLHIVTMPNFNHSVGDGIWISLYNTNIHWWRFSSSDGRDILYCWLFLTSWKWNWSLSPCWEHTDRLFCIRNINYRVKKGTNPCTGTIAHFYTILEFIWSHVGQSDELTLGSLSLDGGDGSR